MSTSERITLDAGQQRAVGASIEEAWNVVAGAGTGKTSVLVERYLKLVEEDGVPLDRLLALTFTLKAAGEMRERIRREIERRRPELARHLGTAWILNFHQFGYRLIKENAPALGIDPGIDVMSPVDFERIRQSLRARFESGRLDDVRVDFGEEPPTPGQLGSLFDSLMKVVDECRSNLIDTDELRRLCRADDAPAYVARVELAGALAREYAAELRRRNLIDFQDMIAIPARALRENRTVADRYTGAFDHILVDEFQDTSRSQFEMLRSLAGDDLARVTVVGDVKQAIYRWRDARIENLLEFPAPRHELTRNYRSTQAILDLAHGLVEGAPGLDGFTPRLEAHRAGGVVPVLYHPRESVDRREDEARAVAAWIEHLLGRAPAPPLWRLPPVETPLAPGAIAVLVRKLARGAARRALEEEFTRRGLPYAIVGGANTTEADALDAWCEFLSLLLPGDSTVHLLAVLECRPWQVSEATLHALLTKRPPRPAVSALLAEERVGAIEDVRDAALLRDLRGRVAHLEVALRRTGFREFLARAVERSGLRLDLTGAGVSANAVDELLREVFDLADALARRSELNLASFIDHLRASMEAGKFREDGDVRLPRDRVAIMTIHQAKGLEFPAVAVVGTGPYDARSESVLISRASGVYFDGDDAREWKRHLEHAENRASEKAMEELEERCVLYVALTRAQDHLWVSSPLAEGTKPRKRAGDRTSLFTELLECARASGAVIEVRDAPDPSPSRVANAATALPQQELEPALRDWVTLRSAAEAVDRAEFAAPSSFEMVTWSALARFAACPLAFAFDRAAGGPVRLDENDQPTVPPRDDVPAAALPRGVDPGAFGAYVHAAVDALARDDARALDDTLETLAKRFEFGAKRDAAVRAAHELIEPARSHGLVGPSAGVRTEATFAVRLQSLVVHGVIDRVDETSRGALVTDYKTGDASESHAFQTRVYTWAVDRIRRENAARGRVVYLRSGEASSEDVASSATSADIERIAVALDGALASGVFAPTPGPVCAGCSHRATCPHAL